LAFSVDYHGDPKGIAMKLTTISLATASLAAALALSVNFANAQSGVPSGRGSTTGDPAARA
jgi:hypothetical protein